MTKLLVLLVGSLLGILLKGALVYLAWNYCVLQAFPQLAVVTYSQSVLVGIALLLVFPSGGSGVRLK